LGTEHDLLRRARAWDEPALVAVFDTYYPAIYRYIYGRVGDEATAEDLAAEVFTRMLEKMAVGKGPRHHLRGWLYRVASNLVVDHSRRSAVRRHESLDEQTVAAESDLVDEVHASLSRAQAGAALAELTPQQRAVIVLRFLEGWENSEVARALDTTVGAVKALQHRALASMRRYLDKQETWTR
jgi:RNA polymerase sigma-70 factor (ECF subfamily)